MKTQFITVKQAADLLNVSIATIKRWTDEGKLDCIKTAGGHRKFLVSHIEQFLKDSKIKTSWSSVVDLGNKDESELNYFLLQKNFDYLVDYLVDAASWSQAEQVNQVIRGLYLNQTDVTEIYDSLVTPALHKIGDLWEQGKMSVFIEHVSSQIIRDEIIQMKEWLPFPSTNRKKALAIVMSWELHDIALKMVELILETKGFNVIFSGQLTPSLKLEHIIDRYKPERFYISSTYIHDLNFTQAEFDKICYLAEKNNIEIIIGGQGFETVEYTHFKHIKKLNSFEEVSKY